MSVVTIDPVSSLEAVRRTIQDVLLPDLRTDAARVNAQMLCDVLANVERRIAHEQVWLLEETDHMLVLLERAAGELANEPGAQGAVDAARAVLGTPRPAGYDLARFSAVAAVYAAASGAIDEVIEILGHVPAPERFDGLLAEIQRYLLLRNDHELVMAGNEPFRGRG